MKSPNAVTLRFAAYVYGQYVYRLRKSVPKEDFLNGIEYFNNEVDEDEK
jgi:hypothetical protein